MIIIMPEAGLCNRLRAIDSAVALAARHKMKLHIIWERNEHCNDKFSNLFIVPKEVERLTEIKGGFAMKVVKKLVSVYLSLTNKCYLDQKKIENLMSQKNGFETLSGCSRVYIRSYGRFYQSALPFSIFRPKAPIQEIITSYKEDNIIGVHVRRTDHQYSITYSPTEKFIEYMNKEIDKDSNVKFFLATDDPSVEITLRKVFPNKIVSHCKKSLDRNNPTAIQDAVVDLYCLSNCRKLIGSYSSSFSDIASGINGIDKVIVKKGNF